MNKHNYILGPCAAETQQQVVETANELEAGLGKDFVFRAGVWKPRTHPDSFQGVGAEALSWLMQIQQERGISCATEVATAEHTRLCMEAGLHYIWIGARTVTSPFLVQQIADTIAQSPYRKQLKGVFVKNPVSADLQLWIGAIERVRKAGVEHIAAIHRGFTPTPDSQSEYRNAPIWSIPIELRRLYPTLPIIADPSHMGGRRELLPLIAQQAADLAFDGLMLECHPTPKEALSDHSQQLTPKQLIGLLQQLHWHEQREADHTLLFLRQQIDETDKQLWQLLLRRMQIAKQIGEHKQQQNLPVLQSSRYEEILQKRLQWAEQNGISTDTVKQMMELIHEESVRVQIKK